MCISSFMGTWNSRNYSDPLSPFLFTMVVEALSDLLFKAKECALIGGFQAGIGLKVITHLLVADDTVLFNPTRWEELATLKRILRCFELPSGLKISLSKSMTVGVGYSMEVVLSFANKLHYKVGKMPLIYLGMPIGVRARSKAVWDLVVWNFE